MTFFKVLLYGIISLTLCGSGKATTTATIVVSSSPSASPTVSATMSTNATVTASGPGVSLTESASSSNSTFFTQFTTSILTTSNLLATAQSSGTIIPRQTPSSPMPSISSTTTPVSSTTTPATVPPSTTTSTEIWDKAIDLATPMGTFIIVIVAVALVLILLITLIIVCCKYSRLKKRTKFPDHMAINDNDWIRSNDDLLMWERNLRASEVKTNNGISNRPFNEKRA